MIQHYSFFEWVYLGLDAMNNRRPRTEMPLGCAWTLYFWGDSNLLGSGNHTGRAHKLRAHLRSGSGEMAVSHNCAAGAGMPSAAELQAVDGLLIVAGLRSRIEICPSSRISRAVRAHGGIAGSHGYRS